MTMTYGKPSSFEDLWELYRGLANVRPALPVSDEYLAVQDAMLSDLNRQHVTDLKDLKPIKVTISLLAR
ncbi:macro domain protein [Staphylococcus aureus]|uniref:Macro domain protein n=1 Tax=Staphylococcus aureus TaxID=1280 RepID=A0A380EEF5_STAAU|nr:macro domain protein [Staphylococcus aureus]